MEEKDKIWIASKCAEKGYSQEDLKYGDDLYNFSGDERDILLDEIWSYVTEYKTYGSHAFREKYKEHQLY